MSKSSAHVDHDVRNIRNAVRGFVPDRYQVTTLHPSRSTMEVVIDLSSYEKRRQIARIVRNKRLRGVSMRNTDLVVSGNIKDIVSRVRLCKEQVLVI